MAVSTHGKKIKNLMKKGTLTGFEVAKIVISILWDVESEVQSIPHREVVKTFDPVMSVDGIDSFLDKNLAQHCGKHAEFDNWTMAFPAMVYARDKALILYLETTNTLSVAEAILEQFITEAIIRHKMKWIPEIVTEKQYQDLKAQQRKELLQEKSSLERIIFNRASSHTTTKHEGWMIEDLLEGSPNEQKDAIKYFKQACSEVFDFIKEGKLSVTYRKKALCLLERIQTKPDNEILAIMDFAISAEPKRKIKEPEPYLEKSTAEGKALYNNGWPEWISWVDNYKHNLDKSAPYEVAVIQNPSSHQVDERGYYIKRNGIADHPFIKMQDNPIWEKIKLTPRRFFSIQFQKAEQNIARFLFYRSVLRAVSDVLGLNLTSEIDEWYKDLETIWDSLEEGIDKIMALSQKAKDVFSNIPVIEMEDLMPSPEVIQYIERRIREPLNIHEWIYDCEMASYKEKSAVTPEPVK